MAVGNGKQESIAKSQEIFLNAHTVHTHALHHLTNYSSTHLVHALVGFENTLSQSQKLLAQQESENARMQHEMEVATRARESERTAEQRTTMERMLMRSMQQLGGGGNSNGGNTGAATRSDALLVMQAVIATGKQPNILQITTYYPPHRTKNVGRTAAYQAGLLPCLPDEHKKLCFQPSLRFSYLIVLSPSDHPRALRTGRRASQRVVRCALGRARVARTGRVCDIFCASFLC